MKPLRKHLTREEVNDEEGDLEMAYSVAYQHTDGYRNHDGSNLVHGVKKVGTDRKSVGPQWLLMNIFLPIIWIIGINVLLLQHERR